MTVKVPALDLHQNGLHSTVARNLGAQWEVSVVSVAGREGAWRDGVLPPWPGEEWDPWVEGWVLASMVLGGWQKLLLWASVPL